MSEDPRVEAAADALWRMGNERIGFREWSEVGHHYEYEAHHALAAADAVDPLRQGPISGGVLELCERLAEAVAGRDRYRAALERIANFDTTKERSGVNVTVLRGIAAAALAPEHQGESEEGERG